MSKPYKTYWDLSEKERACLTDEQFKKFTQIELMEAGCAVLPDKPEELNLPPMEPLKMSVWYEVGGELLFSSMEDALTVMNLKPFKKSWVSALGYNQHKAEQVTDAPKTTTCVDAEEVSRRNVELTERKAKETQYDRQLSEWKKANGEVKSTLESINEDWYAVKEKDRLYKNIVNSLHEYTDLAGGDVEIAKNFLKKRFSEDEIEAAIEWCENDE